MRLVIGSKNLSSWSLRAWLILREGGIPFEEMVIPLARPETRELLARWSPTGRVPVLQDGDVLVWDSLAIAEYAAELSPRLWPDDRAARAMARSVAAEMHAGFTDLRTYLPMDATARFTPPGKLLRGVAADLGRIQTLWRTARDRFGQDGPYLFGRFSIADAMFAPIVSRLVTHAVPVDAHAQAYLETILRNPSMQEWLAGAAAEVAGETTALPAGAPAAGTPAARAVTRPDPVPATAAATGAAPARITAPAAATPRVPPAGPPPAPPRLPAGGAGRPAPATRPVARPAPLPPVPPRSPAQEAPRAIRPLPTRVAAEPGLPAAAPADRAPPPPAPVAYLDDATGPPGPAAESVAASRRAPPGRPGPAVPPGLPAEPAVARGALRPPTAVAGLGEASSDIVRDDDPGAASAPAAGEPGTAPAPGAGGTGGPRPVNRFAAALSAGRLAWQKRQEEIAAGRDASEPPRPPGRPGGIKPIGSGLNRRR